MVNTTKALAEHAVNGNPGRRPLPAVSLPGVMEPLGTAPRGMSADGKRVWVAFGKELPWLNATNRTAVEFAVEVVLEYRQVEKFFSRRSGKLRRSGKSPALAYLDDATGKRHALYRVLLDSRAAVRGVLHDLAMLSFAQAQMLRHVDSVLRARKAEAKDESDEFLT